MFPFSDPKTDRTDFGSFSIFEEFSIVALFPYSSPCFFLSTLPFFLLLSVHLPLPVALSPHSSSPCCSLSLTLALSLAATKRGPFRAHRKSLIIRSRVWSAFLAPFSTHDDSWPAWQESLRTISTWRNSTTSQDLAPGSACGWWSLGTSGLS